MRRSVTFIGTPAISPHGVSLNNFSVDMNNVPSDTTCFPLSDQCEHLIGCCPPGPPKQTTPLRADWSECGECDAEFDRLISGRSSNKGRTDGTELSTRRERMFSGCCCDPLPQLMLEE
ncbi:hypothetical protein PBY51_003757 [Eleginops maclovinus]|uniref:Uncharacterized protein n=1 Tax=Eleginops maclovinus TaxID=56733 RepID=A0AAN7XYL0_ELEMC|nr:hypothetical protein PBY51_003757 [Eleginops maclovinus]